MKDSLRDPFDVHTGRVLLLVRAFSGGARGRLEGLSKIARLDFLLRYPVYLERLLDRRGAALPFELWPSSAERRAVESTMLRHKFGPFEARYYLIVGRLIGLGLCEQSPERRLVSLRITAAGVEATEGLIGAEWQVVAGRAWAAKRSLDLSGEALGTMIAELLPPSENRPWAVLSVP